MGKKVSRLFEQFQPQSYTLKIQPDAAKMTFDGKVTITGKKTSRPSERITLHQKGLKVTKAKVTKILKNSSEEVAVSRINSQKIYDELRIHTDQTLYPGEYTIELEFSGKITDAMHGLYPCYFEHEGKKKKLLATQFESHHAREVFPCIDEPEAKAIFDLTLITQEDEVVLSNTPSISQKPAGSNQIETVFETTPVMSTYLLAFVIGELHSTTAQTKDGINVNTWSTVAQPASHLEYANQEAVKILEFFTEYFDTPFPLKKCDQVALPDFEAGAMENWGLITYREIALLADPKNRSLSSEQYVSMVVGHEMSHQWFGNLVTMKWWDDLWLNESFASIMEHIALDKLHPDWFQWEQYTASDVISCSWRDIFKDVQPVQVEVNHPAEISTLFDPAIVYAKGGRLLKMMHDYIGDDAFRKGLKSYFTKHAYKNTVGNDLWQDMSLASGKDISAFMNPWLSQSGMPMVEVTHQKDTAELTQSRFVLDKKDDKRLWPIPLLAAPELDINIFNTKSVQAKRSSAAPSIINQSGSGHMVVHYTDQATRDFISEAFAASKIKPESRINILNDMMLLARRGDAPLTDALDIVSKASHEPREAVWALMVRAIGLALGLIEGDEETENNIKAYRRALAEDWYKKLGWNDHDSDSPNDKALRQTILSLMVASEDKDALDEALKRFSKAKNVAEMPAEQRAMIVGAAVKHGKNVIDQLIKEYETSPNPDVQLSICLGLCATKDPKVGEYIINKALGPKGFVRPQDIFRWYAYLMRNRYTRTSAWEWQKANWNRLEKMFGDGKSLDYFVIYSAGPINTPDWQKKFIDFFEPKSDDIALKRNIMVAYSEIEARIKWRQREESKIKQYFAKYSKQP